MATGQAAVLAGQLRAVVAAHAGERAGDGELLGRFVERRDGEAFAALVRRHGSMVLGVARRLARGDAEDVFQATFLVLARRAASVRRRESVGSWLYGVAVRLARRAGTAAARRQAREGAAARAGRTPRGPADPSAEVSLREAREALDEELSRLPEKYRAPLVLCCLEGLARDEAARRLGWPTALIKSRLEQARERLHRRLVRRGLTLAGALAAGLLADSGAVAASRELVRDTARAALRFAAAGGAGGASPGALALAQSAGLSLRGRAAVALTLAVSLAAGVGLLLAPPQTPAAPRAEPGAPADPKGPDRPAAKAEARTDRHGDPLPEGALVRFGTDRLRCVSPGAAALSPDGTVLATTSFGEIILWDVASGRARRRIPDADVPPDFSPNQTFLAFSPDGTRLVSLGGWDPTSFGPGLGARKEPAVRVWDVATGKEVRRFDLLGGTRAEHYLPARAVWFTPDGKQVGVLLHSGVCRFLDPATGSEYRRFATGKPLRQECPGVAPSPDGTLLAIVDANRENSISLFDGLTGRQVRRVTGPAKFEILAFSPDSSLLAAADTGSAVRLFEVATGKEIRSASAGAVPRTKGLHMGLTALAFGTEGGTLYAGDQQGRILRWRVPAAEALPDLAAGEVRQPFDSTGWVTGLLVPPDGRSLISVGWMDGVIRRWDVSGGKELPGPGGFSGAVHARRSPDGRSVAVGDQRGRLEVFDARDGRPVRVLRPAGPWVSEMCWSPDGRTLAVGQTDQAVGLWDVEAGREVRTLPRPPVPLFGALYLTDGLAFSADGRQLLISQGSVGTRLVDTASGKEVWHREGWGKVAFAPDGKAFALAGVDGFGRTYTSLHVGDARTGAVRASHRFRYGAGGAERVGDVAFAPDGRWLASTHGGTVRLRDPRTGDERRRLQGPPGVRCSSVAFAPDGKWLLTGWSDGRARLFEVATGKEAFALAGHGAAVGGVEFGPDGRTALSCSGDKTALLWELRPPAPAGRPAGAGSAWDALASGDAARAYRAVWGLADDPASAALLRQKLPPARSAVDEGRMRRLVADLDADAFETRDRAARELAALGRPVVPLLRKALAEGKPPEARRRLQALVEELTSGPGGDDLRIGRAVQSQELAATPEAKALLRAWAAGLPRAPLTEESRAALDRLEAADRRRGAAAAEKP